MRTTPVILDHLPEVGERLELREEAFAALQLWQPRPGQGVTVMTAEGASFRARVLDLTESVARLLIYERMTAPAESSLELLLLQALPDKERMELIVEKATELGVDLIVPWKAGKGIDLAEREQRQPKAHRFAARALKAARQCRRGRIPAVMPFTDLDTALNYAAPGSLKIALWESPARPLKEVLAGLSSPLPTSAAVLVGPEGGLTPAEVEKAQARGFVPVSLGSRILRTETAALTALALLQFALGDLGGVSPRD